METFLRPPQKALFPSPQVLPSSRKESRQTHNPRELLRLSIRDALGIQLIQQAQQLVRVFNDDKGVPALDSYSVDSLLVLATQRAGRIRDAVYSEQHGSLTPELYTEITAHMGRLLRVSAVLKQSVPSVQTLINQAVLIHGGDMPKHGRSRTDYAVFGLVEQKPWWNKARTYLKQYQPGYLKRWEDDKYAALTIEVERSIGQSGMFGNLLEMVAGEEYTQRRGHKVLSRILTQMNRHTIFNTQMTGVSEEILERVRAFADRHKIMKTRTKVDTVTRPHPDHSQLAKDTTAIMQSNRPVAQQILRWCDAFDRHGVPLPGDIAAVRTRIRRVQHNTDRVEDSRRRLAMINTYQVVALSGHVLGGVAETVIPHARQMAERAGRTAVAQTAQWLIDTEAGHRTLSIAERMVLAGLKYVPTDSLVNALVDDQTMELFQQPSPERLQALMERVLSDALGQGNPELTRIGSHEYFQSLDYPQAIRDQLEELWSKENPDYLPPDQLIAQAIALYDQQDPQHRHPVFWQRHPAYMGLEEFLRKLVDRSKEETGDGVRSANFYRSIEWRRDTENNLDTIMHFSDSHFLDFDYVALMYQALHPDLNGVSSDQVQAWFSDYFNLIFSYRREHNQPMPIASLIAEALRKNEGDMHAALWDAAIAVKLFTRNSMINGDNTAGSRYSGWSAQFYLQDSLSRGYTAQDLSHILPGSKYWNTDAGTFPKEFDPANQAGTLYHDLFFFALLGEFPPSAVAAGVVAEFYFGGDQLAEYGVKKMRNQIDYLQNLPGAEAKLDALPPAPEQETETVFPGSLSIIPVPDLSSSRNTELWKTLQQGGTVVFFVDGQPYYASLAGSMFHPYLLVGDTPEAVARQSMTREAFFEATFEQGDRFMDRLLESGTSIETPTASGVRQTQWGELDITELTHLVLAEDDFSDGRLDRMMDDAQRRALFASIKTLNPDDWGWHASRCLPVLLPILTLEDIRDMWSHGGFDMFLNQYQQINSPDIADILPPNVLYAELKSFYPDSWVEHVYGQEGVFQEVMTLDDLSAYFRRFGGYSVFDVYDSKKNPHSLRTILDVFKKARPLDWEETVLNLPIIFGPIFTRDDLAMVLSIKPHKAEELNSYLYMWKAYFPPDVLLDVLKSVRPDDWEDIVKMSPEIFGEAGK